MTSPRSPRTTSVEPSRTKGTARKEEERGARQESTRPRSVKGASVTIPSAKGGAGAAKSGARAGEDRVRQASERGATAGATSRHARGARAAKKHPVDAIVPPPALVAAREGAGRVAPVELTRDRIRDVALDVFAEHGFEGTSTREICARAGVNGAALNYHWRSKQQLWEAVCERCGLWFGGIAAQINLGAPPGDAIAGFLRLVFDGLVRDPRPIRVVGWANLLPHDADRDGVANHFKPFVGFAYAYIRAQQAVGAIPANVDTDVFVLLIHNMLTYTLLNMRGMRSAIGADLTDPALAGRFREAIVTVALDLLELSETPKAPPG